MVNKCECLQEVDEQQQRGEGGRELQVPPVCEPVAEGRQGAHAGGEEDVVEHTEPGAGLETQRLHHWKVACKGISLLSLKPFNPFIPWKETYK